MKDLCGLTLRLGDSVALPNGETGVVVFSIDTDEYDLAFPKEDWAYLGHGVMIKVQSGALVHIDDRDSSKVKILNAK